MHDATKSQALFLESFTLWADTYQQVLRELVDLSATTAKETARLHGELQSSAVEAIRETQSDWLTRQANANARQVPSDPVVWYQKALTESIESAQKAFRFIEGGAQAVTKSAEQLQAAAERTGKEIQETFSALATRMQQVYSAA